MGDSTTRAIIRAQMVVKLLVRISAVQRAAVPLEGKAPIRAIEAAERRKCRVISPEATPT